MPGYSYLQLVCVLVILGIISSIALPNFKQVTINHKLNLASTTLQHIIRFAHSTALANNVTVNIRGIHHNWQNGIELVTETKVFKQFAALPVHNLTWYGFGNDDQIAIRPNGMTFNNGHFILSQNGYHCSLYLNNALKMHQLCNLPE